MNDFDGILDALSQVAPGPEDYIGENGLLYCGKCRTPKQFRMKAPPLMGRLLPHPCRCDHERIDREAAAQEARRHRQAVADLKRHGFTGPTMQKWTFTNDNGRCQQMKHALFYVEHWDIMQVENIGYLLWGGVGTGKSYFAGCITNALIEQEVAVHMTNFALMLNTWPPATRAGMSTSPTSAAPRCLSWMTSAWSAALSMNWSRSTT